MCDYEAVVISDHGPSTTKIRIPNTQYGYRPEESLTNFISSEIKLFLDLDLVQLYGNL